MSAEKTLRVLKLHPEARLPARRAGDIGWDLFALSSELAAPNLVKVRTGIAVELPEGYYGQIENRSSMGLNGWDVHGGIIDNHYRGEILVVLVQHKPGVAPAIEPGSKIAQMIIRREEDREWRLEEAQALTETERGSRGFGSTGR